MSAPYTMQALQELADDGVHLLEIDDAGLVATVQELDALRARVAELERVQDAAFRDAHRAEADAARLREALEDIARVAYRGSAAASLARAALASAPNAEPTPRDTLNAPQPPPTSDDAGHEVWPALLAEVSMSPELRALCEERDALGRAKYGTALRVNNGRAPLVDALQEALDLAVYLHQCLMRDGVTPRTRNAIRMARLRALDTAQMLLGEATP